ncbi:MAG: DEAD/DEAH box helicase [Oligoflexales bacterium]
MNKFQKNRLILIYIFSMHLLLMVFPSVALASEESSIKHKLPQTPILSTSDKVKDQQPQIPVAKKRKISRPITFSNKLTGNELPRRLDQLFDEYSKDQDLFLRDYQKKTLVDILQSFKNNKKKIAIEMPTGTGKTAIFSKLISMVQNTDTPYRIIVAVPTVSLIEQTVEKFEKYSKKLPSLKEEVGEWYQRKKTIRPITVTTIQSLTSKWQKLKDLDYQATKNWDNEDDYFHPYNPNTLIIFDEAHKTNGNTINNIISRMPREKHVIGFSASLSDYENLPLEIVSSLKLHESIKIQAISGVQFMDIDFSYHQNLDFLRKSLKTDGKDLTKEQLEVFDNLLSQTSGISSTVAQIAKNIFLNDNSSNNKIMVFTNTQDHADNLKEIFDAIGMSSLTVHGNMKFHEKNKNLNTFKSENSNINIMISCGVLDEGFDLHSVKVIIDFGIYIKKPRRLVQRLGRATRPSSNNEISAKYIRVKILPDDTDSSQLNPRTIGLLGQVGENISHLGVKESDILRWNLPFNLESIDFYSKEISPYEVRLKFPDSDKVILLKTDGSFEEELESEIPLPMSTNEGPVDGEFQDFLEELLGF